MGRDKVRYRNQQLVETNACKRRQRVLRGKARIRVESLPFLEVRESVAASTSDGAAADAPTQEVKPQARVVAPPPSKSETESSNESD